ncbi:MULTISPECIES: hypothetical protein [unclassified Salinibacterium]|uniref:hypothetical protein n=1 Tax=unclassified Salinibacterium TaxID=2632331 RepID=UPI00141FD7DC|nr:MULTISPECIES: hypothetical protein [unclassified Salinibacterium]
MSDETEQLQRDLDELREAVLDDWVLITARGGDALRAFQNTFSWRVTRPLRVFRRFEKRVHEIGFVPSSQLAAAALARKLGKHR